jgi:hypothetical protein
MITLITYMVLADYGEYRVFGLHHICDHTYPSARFFAAIRTAIPRTAAALARQRIYGTGRTGNFRAGNFLTRLKPALVTLGPV